MTNTSNQAFSTSALDDFIEQRRNDWKTVGLAVAIVRDTQVIYARGFGDRQFGQPAKVDADTLFQVGSTTKAFTAAALGSLVDDKKLSWDDLLIQHLPGFRLRDPWLTENATIRDALAHRSGIIESIYPFLSIMDSQETVRRARYVAAKGLFRDSYCYSNLMYAVAGKVVESACGKSWRDYIRSRLLEPLSMTRSGTSPYEYWDAEHVTPAFLGNAPSHRRSTGDARDANVAMPHTCATDGGPVVLPWQSYDSAAPAGALVSSAADMANWLIVNVDAGRFQGRRILSERVLQELHATQNRHGGISAFPSDAAGAAYAMGWQKAQYRGHVILSHSGAMMGFHAYAALLPEEKIGIVVLGNGSLATCEQLSIHKVIAFRAFDHLLGLEPHGWNGELLDRAQGKQQTEKEREESLCRARLPDSAPSLSLDRYAGTYKDPIDIRQHVTVHVVNDSLELRFEGDGAFSAPLEHWHQDVFRLRPSPGIEPILGPMFVTFCVSPLATVASITAFDIPFQKIAPEPQVASHDYANL
jgi:CubicO group peptidase (beta-lactamase class C family)